MSIESQGHFLTLAQGRVHTKIKNGFYQKLLCSSIDIDIDIDIETLFNVEYV